MINKALIKRGLVYSIIITFVVLTTRYTFPFIQREYFIRFNNILLGYIIANVSYIIFGILLGLEYYMIHRKINGSWKINYVKLIVLVIPSAIFTMSLMIAYSALQFPDFMNNILFIPASIAAQFQGLHRFTSILLGYSLITLFYKIGDVENQEEFDDSDTLAKNISNEIKTKIP